MIESVKNAIIDAYTKELDQLIVNYQQLNSDTKIAIFWELQHLANSKGSLFAGIRFHSKSTSEKFFKMKIEFDKNGQSLKDDNLYCLVDSAFNYFVNQLKLKLPIFISSRNILDFVEEIINLKEKFFIK